MDNLINENQKPITIVDLLLARAQKTPDRILYTFLEDGDNISETMTFQQFTIRAQAVAAQLQAQGKAGERVLLLYPSCIDYMVGFFACLLAGMIAVPVFPPRSSKHNARLEVVLQDCAARIALTTDKQQQVMRTIVAQSPELSALHYICSDSVDASSALHWQHPMATPDTIAFLQYTSGSTGNPKGVVVTHKNIDYNERMLQTTFDTNEDRPFVTWLPIYHDMGLIGNMLHALWAGSHCVFMPSVYFLQRPVRWLQAISRFGGYFSGGPNFSFDLCVQKVTAEQKQALDLSSWKAAFNGAEPVRRASMENFAAAFAECGFSRQALMPCYGMAETTLLVSSVPLNQPPGYLSVDSDAMKQRKIVLTDTDADGAQSLVACGETIMAQQIRIVNPDSKALSAADEIGEIWVSGDHVSTGYWQKPEVNEVIFNAHIAGSNEGPFVRTGDLGCMHDNQLYICGRLKDVIILRGSNYYPQDIEQTVEQCHADLANAGATVFGYADGSDERAVVVAEVERVAMRRLDHKAVVGKIRQAVLETHDLVVNDVVLIRPGTLPKTSSGKVQRSQCRALYLNKELADVLNKTSKNADTEAELVL